MGFFTTMIDGVSISESDIGTMVHGILLSNDHAVELTEDQKKEFDELRAIYWNAQGKDKK